MKNCDEITRDVLARRDAHNEKIKKRNRMIMRIGVPSVSLCLAVIVGIGMWRTGEFKSEKNTEDAIVPGIVDVISDDDGNKNAAETEICINPGIVTEVLGGDKPSGGKDECGDGEDEIFIEPTWTEKALNTKYPEFEYGGTRYNTAATWIDKEKLGDVIGTSVAHGYDIYTDTSYDMGVTVYTINGINTEAAVAVSYNGFEGQYAVYTDAWYYPETLGEFIDALDLGENLTLAIRDEVPTGTVYHTFWEYESYMTTRYKLYDTTVIWNMLFSDTSLKNEANEVTDEEMSLYKESMSIGVSVDILGIENVSLAVTENGYISTNILGTRKLFCIGEDKAQEFFDYVKANLEGVREEPPSTTAAVSTDYPDDVIVTAVTETSKPHIPEIIEE